MAANAAYGFVPDYTQWQTWEPITRPDGTKLYKVPNSNKLYDPFLSGQRGRPVLFNNNKAEYDTQQKAISDQKKAQENASNPINQLAPLAGSIGGLYLANQVSNMGATTAAPEVLTPLVVEAPAVAAAAPAAPAALAPSVPTMMTPGLSGSATGQAAYNSAANASTAAAAAPTAATNTLAYQNGFTGANIASGIAAVKGTYDTIKGFDNGGEGMRSGLTTAGAGIGGLIGGPIGAGAGAVAGNIVGYGLQGDGIKNDIALGLMTGGSGLLLKKLGLLTPRQTTRQKAQENTVKLLKQNKDDPVYQSYVKAMRQQSNQAPPDPSKPFAGKYANFTEYKKAGLEAGDLTGVFGNIKTFGKEWTGLDFEKQKQATQALINADLYDSKKGEVIIKDEAKAKAVVDALGLFGMPSNPAVKKPGVGNKENPAVRNSKPFQRAS